MAMAITSRSRPLVAKTAVSKTSTDETVPKAKASAARRSRTSAARKRGMFAVNVPGFGK